MEMLREIISPEFSTTYCGKLYNVASTCTDIATTFVEHVEGRRSARSRPSPPDDTAQHISNERNQLLSEAQLGNMATPGFSTNLPSHSVGNLYGQDSSRLVPSDIQSQPQINPLVQYPIQSNGSSPAAFLPSHSSNASQSTSQTGNLTSAQQARANNSNSLNGLDPGSFGSFGDSMDFDSFGAFDFDMDALWGDPQLLEEMARDTNSAIMANGYV